MFKFTFTLILVSLIFVPGQAQTADRIKVYIKIESEKNQYKIASSLRSRLKPYKKHFLFVFPGAQKENNPDITFTVKEYAADPRWAELFINGTSLQDKK